MGKRKGGKNRNGKSRGHVATMRAPTMNGMQQVNTWRLQDFVPLSLGETF
jgi:hypothetical protein